ncbi:MAG TPA: hypothetical protein DD671_00530, partial [Balneolaceae bacterium]|nr:hypothetical protein [Balneolaceae bacterium]
LAHFTNDSVQARIGELQGTVEGTVTQDIEQMNVTWGFTAYEMNFDDYALEILFGSGSIKDGIAQATIEAKDGKDHIATYTDVDALFSETPSWEFRTRIERIDLGWWIRDPNISGLFSLTANVKGKGFGPSEEPWTFSIKKPVRPELNLPENFDRSSVNAEIFRKYTTYKRDTVIINGQKFANLDVEGTITKDAVEADGFLQLIENKIEFSTNISDYLEDRPDYTFSLGTKRFNALEIAGVEDFPTSINLNITGEGSSFDPENIRLSSTLNIDSSFVNGATFESLNMIAEFQDNILTIPQGELESEVIAGSFTVRRNIMDVTDPQNDITLDMEIKNTQPLAQLAGVNVLSASGNISGNITTESEDQLQFNGNVDLNDVRYDTLFTAQNISGETAIMISENYGFETALSIREPVINGLSLEDINLQTKGVSSPDSVYGSFKFDINSVDAGQISQTGSYHVMMDSWTTRVIWSAFQFETPARILSLQQPFRLHYADATLQTDTLKLQSDGGTFLNLAIPYADSISQDIWAEGQDFDFGVIQEIIFDERFVDGVLSGALEVHNNPDSLRGSGTLNFSRLAYQGTNVDQLRMNFDVQKERLNADLSVTMNGEEKMYGMLDLPFIAAEPATLSDDFFQEQVRGELVINPVSLSEFENLLTRFDITGTEGILSFRGNLSGTAAEPNMDGVFELRQPTLSGVKIDSAFAEFQYHHQQEKITAAATINAQGQQAASINAESPVYIDFQTFEFNPPNPTDTLIVHVVTDQFNISVFNDFLNKEYMRNLRGILNAELHAEGPFNELEPSGFVSLHSGHLRVPVAGISLTSINSELEFTDSGLNLNSFSMKSGGAFTANGRIELNGLSPAGMNINANATRFKAANTDNYNLTVDLNSTISGNPLRPEVSGRLAVKNGFIFLQDFGEKSVEDVTLDDEDVSSFSPYDSLSIDMQFEIER